MCFKLPWLLLVAVAVLAVPETLGSDSLQEVQFGPSSDILGLVGGAPKGAAAVIVIQEFWGITEQIKAHALRIGRGGYRILIPDIYKGKIGVDAEEASHLMSTLDFKVAVREISHAAAFLKAEGAPKIGVVGFCMGGALTLGSLAASDDIDCGAPFYGVNFDLFDAKALTHKPVQGHFGQLDATRGFSDPETGKKLQADLSAAGNTAARVWIYDNVGHSFLNDKPDPYKSFEERKAKLGFPAYDATQAELAWKRLGEFFGSILSDGRKNEL